MRFPESGPAFVFRYLRSIFLLINLGLFVPFLVEACLKMRRWRRDAIACFSFNILKCCLKLVRAQVLGNCSLSDERARELGPADPCHGIGCLRVLLLS